MGLICIQVALLLVQLTCLCLFVRGAFSWPMIAQPPWLPVARFLAIWLVVPAVIITLVYRTKHISDE